MQAPRQPDSDEHGLVLDIAGDLYSPADATEVARILSEVTGRGLTAESIADVTALASALADPAAG